MLEYLLNTSTNIFCQYCPRSETSDVEHSWGASAKLPESRPPPHWTGRVLQKGHMFRELSVFIFVCVMSAHGWMRKDVWVNVFTMPFLCADSGPWRKMSRTWPPMSAITTSSGSTCPSHQESVWGAAEARQERDIVEIVRKCISAGRCSIICWTHLQMFSVSTVPGEEASDVGAVLKSICQASWTSPTTTLDRKRTTKWRRHMFGELKVLLFVLGVCMGGRERTCEWMSLRCHSCA